MLNYEVLVDSLNVAYTNMFSIQIREWCLQFIENDRVIEISNCWICRRLLTQ